MLVFAGTARRRKNGPRGAAEGVNVPRPPVMGSSPSTASNPQERGTARPELCLPRQGQIPHAGESPCPRDQVPSPCPPEGAPGPSVTGARGASVRVPSRPISPPALADSRYCWNSPTQVKALEKNRSLSRKKNHITVF